jgi:1-acyl-sn-glycerol-3-phosphate acyltransferase
LLTFNELSAIERWQIRFVRGTFSPGRIDSVIRFLQRHFSANWVDISTRNLLHVRGVERLPPFGRDSSTILIANHRSFFDLFVVSSVLLKRGCTQRLMFPVRSKFFYDAPLGLVVNGAMSIFAMYPPLFRGRDRAALNRASVGELVRVLRAGNALVGLHPEGSRNRDADPYSFLPARPGTGRIIHAVGSKASVVPVFINGLSNSLGRQVAGNYLKTGAPITIVFGRPVDLDDLLVQPASVDLDQRISDRAFAAVHALGPEDRELRASLHSAS